MSLSSLSSIEAFGRIAGGRAVVVDVRSPKEFADGSFPGVLNVPLLNDEHRKLVGTTYKQQGSEAAIRLGHELVDPIKSRLQEQWRTAAGAHPPLVYCWRGGLRSKIACEWMRDADLKPLQIEGGFKALRTIAIEQFSQPQDMIVVCGLTGTRKTRLIHSFDALSVDLEGIARHRGSAFGAVPGVSQPTQLQFENTLALRLWNLQGQRFFVEDESRGIGYCLLPAVFYEQMSKAPCVLVEEPLEARARWIFEDYVNPVLALTADAPANASEPFLSALFKIEKRLGGLQTHQIAQKIRAAFFSTQVFLTEAHLDWIKDLLIHYYDKQYLFGFSNKNRPLIFRGSGQNVTEKISEILFQGRR